MNHLWSFILFGCLTVCCSTPFKTQSDWKSQTRLVITEYPDSLVHAHVLINQPQKLNLSNVQYHWYASGSIHTSKGSYTGNLLHGEYIVFDSENNLIEKGFFNNGVKEGTWNRWFTDGKHKSVLNWEDGHLQGESTYYNPNGSVYKKVQYNEGKKEGESTLFLGDTIIVKIYRNDIEVTESQDTKKIKK